MKKKPMLTAILGIVIMAIAAAGGILFVLYGQPALDFEKVMVAAVDIPKGTIASPDMFTEVKFDRNLVLSGKITPDNVSGIYGLAATQFIPAKAQVVPAFFQSKNYVVGVDQAVMKIPTTWVYAVPSSIRRGDTALFYEIDADMDQYITQSNLSNTVDNSSLIRLMLGESTPVLSLSVAYVKDSANREVVDTGDGVRMDGSSQVSSIEVIINNDQKRILENSIQNGMKFLVLYNDL